VCVVITLKCAFYYYYCGQVPYAVAVFPLYTYITAATTRRVAYLYTCARAFLLILLLIHVLPFCCNTGPAPDGLTRFSYLLCTGRVARAVSRRRRCCSSLLSNGFAAAVVQDLSYANNIYVHILSSRYIHPTQLTDVILNGFRKRLMRRYAGEERLTRALR